MRQGFLFFILQVIIVCTSTTLYADLVAHWPLDVDANDISGNQYNGTVHGNPVWTSNGWNDGAVELDGVDDYIEIPGYQGITGTAGRTCMAWIKTSVAQSAMILSWGAEQSGQKWTFRIESDGSLGVGVWGGYISTSAIVSDGQWHHVAAVLNDDGSPDVSEILLYIDGIPQSTSASSTQSIDTVASQNVMIGTFENAGVPGSYFSGLIDDVRIYDRALTEQEVYEIGSLFDGGDGSESNPYQISKPQQLIRIRYNDNLLDKHYILTNDIVFDPNNPEHIFDQAIIAAPGAPFFGTFDGNGHAIYNLTIINKNHDSYCGLFGRLGYSSIVQNLGLVNVSIKGDRYVGGLAGESLASIQRPPTIIKNCYVTGTVDGDEYVGGLVGFNHGLITDCYTKTEVGTYHQSNYTGGLVGKNIFTITNSYAAGNVSGYKYVGGLVGENSSYSGIGSISQSYATGSVKGYEYVGGFVGQNDWVIHDCYAKGDVSTEQTVYPYNPYIAGFAGENYSSIQNCYSTGKVNAGNTPSYGFCGGQDGGTILNSFWDVGTSEIGSSGDDNYGAIGKTTSEMQTLSTFTDAGWDFSDTDGDPADWIIAAQHYPLLSWEQTISYNNLPEISLQPDEAGTIQTGIYNFINETLNWTISGDETCSWITGVDPNSGSSTGPSDMTTVTIDVDTAGLDVGDYTHELILSADNGDVVSVPVSLHVFNRVELEEFAVLARYWLDNDCNQTQPCGQADWYLDGTIDVLDLSLMSDYWLQEAPVVLHWPLDGNAENSTGNMYHGTAHGDPSWVTQGHIGGAVELDGVDDYIEIPDYQGVTGTASRTCTAWIKTTQSTLGEVVTWGAVDTGAKWSVGLKDNVLSVRVQGGNIFGSTAVNDGQWHHVAVTWDPGTDALLSHAKLYVDGVEETISSVTDIAIDTAASEDVHIGNIQAGNYFQGLIDDVRIYDRPLTSGEIQTLFNQTQ